MASNDVKVDHEAAKKWAEETWNTLKNIVLDDVTEADAIEYRNAARAYLDAAAQLDEATELPRALKARLDRYESITGDDYADLCAFLAKHRKTGA